MKRLYLQFFVSAMLLTVLNGCNLIDSECGEQKESEVDAAGVFFANPAKIYWGAGSVIRSFTYNFEFGNICTKQNPKLYFSLELKTSNTSLQNPISISAGVITCLGVQARTATMNPNETQVFYVSDGFEIGMEQCFSGQASGTIYPYMTISFNTLGSSQEDSLYLVNNIKHFQVFINYNVAK